MPEIIDYTKVGGTFQDTGEGDVDFYTYWYSICYVVGMLNTYRHIFRDIEQYDEMMRRFLNSRGIANVNSSTVEELIYLYENWDVELQKRGTIRINESESQSEEIGLTNYIKTGVIQTDIDANAGIGVLSNSANLSGTVNSTVDLGHNHTMQFDLLLNSPTGVQYTVDGSLFNSPDNNVHISNSGSMYTFTYTVGGVSVSFDVDLDVTILQRVKIIRAQSKVSLMINDIPIGVEELSSSFEYSFDMLFSAGLPAIANILLTSRNNSFEKIATYNWLCNEGSGFTLECNKSSLYYAVLNISSITDWDLVWFRDGRFYNTGYVGIDGEVKRLVDYKGGEHLFELIATTELGWCMDMSSPISEEASCKNLNKAYEKGEILNMSKFPVSFDTMTKPVIDSGYIKYFLPSNYGGHYGINLPFDTDESYGYAMNIKMNGCMPFIPIPIATEGDNFTHYEVSFVIRSDNNIDLKFSVAVYDSNYERLPNLLNRYSDDVASDTFLDDTAFKMCKGVDLNIRAILSVNKGVDVANKLNINVGDNLYIDGDTNVKFLLPIIAFKNLTLDTNIQIKDIVVRPADLNTSKGVVSNKNKIIAYIKNNSGKSENVITDFIEQKLIPYNCTTNIQYL
jgi:hypothetical protein